MKRKFLTMALVLSLLLGMALPTVAGEEATVSLIPNGGFEAVDEESGTVAMDWDAASKGTVVTDAAGAYAGDRYLSIPFPKVQKTSRFSLAAETHYELRFWAKTTVKNASYVEIKFLKDSSDYTYIAGNKTDGDLYNTEGVYFEWFGVENEVPAEGESINKIPWQEYSFAFTAPKHTIGVVINFAANVKEGATGGTEEHYLHLDNVSLVATGREPNLLRNGYLTAFKADQHPSGWIDKYVPIGGNFDTYALEYIKQPNGEVAANYTMFDKTLGSIFYKTQVFLSEGKYKLSFEYENNNKTEKDRVASVEINGGLIGFHEAPNMLRDCVKNKYEYYFTVSESKAYNFMMMSHWVPKLEFSNGEELFVRISNIRIWKDESGVQYGKSATYTMDTKDRAQRDVFIPVSNISDADLNAGGTAYVVLPKGHYVPKSSDEESFTMVNALYRKYNNGNIVLENVKLTGGAASGGAVSNVNDSMEVPVLKGVEDFTYELHSFILSGMDTLKAMNEKTILTY